MRQYTTFFQIPTYKSFAGNPVRNNPKSLPCRQQSCRRRSLLPSLKSTDIEEFVAKLGHSRALLANTDIKDFLANVVSSRRADMKTKDFSAEVLDLTESASYKSFAGNPVRHAIVSHHSPLPPTIMAGTCDITVASSLGFAQRASSTKATAASSPIVAPVAGVDWPPLPRLSFCKACGTKRG